MVEDQLLTLFSKPFKLAMLQSSRSIAMKKGASGILMAVKPGGCADRCLHGGHGPHEELSDANRGVASLVDINKK